MAGSAPRFVLPYQTVFDAAGVPLPGAQLFFYESGTDTPLNTYSDATLATPNTNPVVANAGGMFPNIFLLPQAYKVVLTDALGDEIWTADPVQGFAGGFIVAARRTVSGDTTVLASDGVLEVNAAGGSVRITYPLVLGAAALVQLVTIVKTDATNNPVLIVSDADVTVPLGALISPADGDNMQSAIVYSDGADLRFI